MNIDVTKDIVKVSTSEQVHKGEYNVNVLSFTFSNDYDGISKMAVFSNSFSTYEVPITNNSCIIPSEVLSNRGTLTIGVYGYTTNNGVLVKRYSPAPMSIEIKNGSYKRGLNPQEQNPTEFEEFVEQLEGDIEDLQAEIDTKQDELTAGTNITISDNRISSYAPTSVSQLTNDVGYITKNADNLVNYELKADVGHSIQATINTSTYVMTLKLNNSAGTTISSSAIDLPIESLVLNVEYDSETRELIITYQSGQTIRISVADLVSGLQAEITSENPLESDLVTDTNQTNKFVTTDEKSSWNAKYNKPRNRNTKNRLVEFSSSIA